MILPFLGGCFVLWFLLSSLEDVGMVVVYCLIGNSSGILPSVATEGFGYNTFLGIWNMTLRNGDRLGVERGGK